MVEGDPEYNVWRRRELILARTLEKPWRLYQLLKGQTQTVDEAYDVFTGQWRLEWRRVLFVLEASLLNLLFRWGKGYLLLSHDVDSWIWRNDPNEKYGVKSEFNIL
ncbi:hypothetical protein VNO77_33711 [Canavalia gladiata]|uniref:Uncharacterized protein n=1 Tax=Canavalia gladiata TaxID=3824 RepID=A0AAN9KEZ6_CANGL